MPVVRERSLGVKTDQANPPTAGKQNQIAWSDTANRLLPFVQAADWPLIPYFFGFLNFRMN
jgi:hypothetical protein